MNIDKIRKDTPGSKFVTHFNNAGASLPTQQVLDATQLFLEQEAITGGYRFAEEEAEVIREFYVEAAKLIHAKPSEIALTQNASASLNLALYSIPFERGDVILTSEIEYGNSYLNYLNLKERKGIEIRVFPMDEEGHFDLEKFESYIDEKVKLIAITHIPTNSGIVAPVEAIGGIAKKYDILYLVDACQAIGQFPFNVEKIGCDFCTATSRKYLRGPRGLGFLYIRESVMENLSPVFLEMLFADWQSETGYQLNRSAKMFETWEKPYSLMVGFTAAIRYANELGMEHIWERIQYLADYFRKQLERVEGVTVHDFGAVKCGIVSFTKSEVSPQKIQQYLQSLEINTSVSARFSSVLDMDRRGLVAVNRASVHYFNTEAEIDLLVDAVSTY
ncbi:MAG: cysteine desulfurase/selenocysteine lyase [Cognaticolwellia sp.]|jgi:cysteine desulfurase/selenocysteine lyase